MLHEVLESGAKRRYVIHLIVHTEQGWHEVFRIHTVFATVKARVVAHRGIHADDVLEVTSIGQLAVVQPCKLARGQRPEGIFGQPQVIDGSSPKGL